MDIWEKPGMFLELGRGRPSKGKASRLWSQRYWVPVGTTMRVTVAYGLEGHFIPNEMEVKDLDAQRDAILCFSTIALAAGLECPERE